MGRGYSREAYLDLIDHVRAVIPGVSISSDFISGFCGETEADHLDTISLMEYVRYDQARMEGERGGEGGKKEVREGGREKGKEEGSEGGRKGITAACCAKASILEQYFYVLQCTIFFAWVRFMFSQI